MNIPTCRSFSKRKILNAGILLLFTVQSALFNLPLQPLISEAKAEATQLSPERRDLLKGMDLPEKIGFVTEVYLPPNPVSEVLFILQDPHNNVKAQYCTAQIYDYLMNHYKEFFPEGHPFVAMEGTPNVKLDYSALTQFPLAEVRRDVSDFLVQEGRLDGTEYYKVNFNPATSIVGIEDEDLYFENIMAFKRADRLKSEIQFKLSDLRKAMDEIKRRAYSYFLKQLDASIRSFEDNPEKIKEHFASLAQIAKAKGVALDSFSSFQTMKRLIDNENKIQKEALGEELAKLGIFQAPFGFESKQEGRKFLAHLEEALEKVPHQTEEFPETARYLDFLKSSLNLRAEEFFGDLEKIYAALTGALAQSEREKRIADHDRKLRLVERMWNFEVTDVEYAYFETLRDALMDTEYWKQLNPIFEEYLLPYRVSDRFYEVTLILLEAERFYKAALARNESLLRNTLDRMREAGRSSSVVVVGGFHAEGITNLLRRQNIPYVLMIPQVGLDEDQSLYWRTLKGEQTSLEKLIRLYTAKAPSAWVSDNRAIKTEALILAVTAAKAASADPSAIAEYKAGIKNDELAKILDSLNPADFTAGPDHGITFNIPTANGQTVPVTVNLKLVSEDEASRLKAEGLIVHPLSSDPTKALALDVKTPVTARSLGGTLTADQIRYVTAFMQSRGQNWKVTGLDSSTPNAFLMQENGKLYRVRLLPPGSSKEAEAAFTQRIRERNLNILRGVDKGGSIPIRNGNDLLPYFKEYIQEVALAATPQAPAQSILDDPILESKKFVDPNPNFETRRFKFQTDKNPEGLETFVRFLKNFAALPDDQKIAARREFNVEIGKLAEQAKETGARLQVIDQGVREVNGIPTPYFVTRADTDPLRIKVINGGTNPQVIEKLLSEILKSSAPHPKFDGRNVIRVEFLAKGGMGEVYKVTFNTGEPVILKIPLEVNNGQRIAQFKKEIDLMKAAKTGQNGEPIKAVVQHFDDGMINHVPWLMMEYVEGGDLADFLEYNPNLGIDKKLDLGIQLAQVIEDYHKSGQIHRDLKPANIMVQKTVVNGKEVLKLRLADFGLAANVGDTPELKREVGTPLYKSPDQIAESEHPDKLEKMDQRSDVYTLGGILYELFTGKKPAGADFLAPVRIVEGNLAENSSNVVLKDFNAKKQALVNAPPLNFLKRLDQIINKAQALDMNKRYQSAGEVAHALEQLAALYQNGYVKPQITSEEVKTAKVAKKELAALVKANENYSERASGNSLGSAQQATQIFGVPQVADPNAAGLAGATQIFATPEQAAAAARQAEEMITLKVPVKSSAELLDSLDQKMNEGKTTDLPEILQGKTITDKKEIGRGAFGVVYKITLSDGQTLALKLPLADPKSAAATNKARERLLEETRALKEAQMDKNNARINEVVEFKGEGKIPGTEMPLLLLEYVNGKNADQFFQEHANLSFSEKLILMREIADTYRRIHEKGLVHRDIKPENILIEEKDGKFIPHILDFGLAVDLSGRDKLPPGLATGTAEYMSPEQVKADHAHLDQRSDIFSLGATLFEMFTGKTLLRENDEEKTDAIMLKIYNDNPILVPDFSFDFDDLSINPKDWRFRQTVLGNFQGILQKSVEKNLARRFQSTQELVNALDQLIEQINPTKLAAAEKAGKPITAQSLGQVTPEEIQYIKTIFGQSKSPDLKGKTFRDEDITFLAAGGMGKVLKVTFSDQSAAVVKFPKPSDDPEVYESNKQSVLLEGKAAWASQKTRDGEEIDTVVRLLDEPGTVMDKNGNQIPYLVMEFVKGKDAKDFLFVEDNGKIRRKNLKELGVEKRLELAAQLADAVGEFHQSGMIHRDLKPANFLMQEIPGKEGKFKPKLSDFGLAKELSKVKFEKPGALLGSPDYMSPEQATGNTQNMDVRSDVYTLGAILFEIMTGSLPVPLSPQEGKGLSPKQIIKEKLIRIAKGNPSPAPSAYLLRQNAEFSRPEFKPFLDLLDKIDKRVRSVEMNARPPTAGQFAAGIRKLLDTYRQAREQVAKEPALPAEVLGQEPAPVLGQSLGKAMGEATTIPKVVNPAKIKTRTLNQAAPFFASDEFIELEDSQPAEAQQPKDERGVNWVAVTEMLRAPLEGSPLKTLLDERKLETDKNGNIAEGTSFQLLGAGGMGEAYKLNFKDGGSLVLKLPIWMDADTLERFRYEVKMTERAKTALGGKNINSVVQFEMAGKDSNTGLPYVVMEFINGKDLRDFIYEDFLGLGANQKRELVRDIAHSFSEFHRSGLVHRDIKPANIMIETVNGKLVPRILDFGLAVESGPLLDPTIISGTLAYMGPEQINPPQVFDYHLTQKTDSYAVASTLFTLVTGRLLTEGMDRTQLSNVLKRTDLYYQRILKNGEEKFINDLIQKHQLANPEPAKQLSESDLKSIGHIIFSALAFNADQRPTTQVMAQAMDQMLQGAQSESVKEFLGKAIAASQPQAPAVAEEVKAAPTRFARVMQFFANLFSKKKLDQMPIAERVALAEQVVRAAPDATTQANALGQPAKDEDVTQILGQTIYEISTGQKPESDPGTLPLPASLVNSEVPPDLSALLDYAMGGDLKLAEFTKMFEGFRKSNGFAGAEAEAPVMARAEKTAAPEAAGVQISPEAIAAARNIFDSVTTATNSGLVFLPFDPQLAEGLLNGSERAMGAKRSGIFLVMSNSKDARDWNANHPNAYQRKAIAVVAYPKIGEIGLKVLAPSDVKNLIQRASSNWRQMGVTNIPSENVAIASPEFQNDLGDTKRLKFDSEKYASNLDYAAAHAMAAMYLALTPPDSKELKEMFERDADGNFKLSESVLAGLVQMIKSKQLVARMA